MQNIRARPIIIIECWFNFDKYLLPWQPEVWQVIEPAQVVALRLIFPLDTKSVYENCPARLKATPEFIPLVDGVYRLYYHKLFTQLGHVKHRLVLILQTSM